MKNTTKRVVAVAGLLALGLTASKAQTDGALLDALVKKGVLSDSEAQDIRAKAAKENAQTSGSKISIGDYVQKLTIYGDARLRFEYADEKAQAGLVNVNAATSGTSATSGKLGDNVIERNRYRLRVGADYVYSDNFKGGFELESNTANDSANQTLGSTYNKANINIGLVYLQWKPVDWLTLTGGKQRNPLYTTDLMWDPDINPEGASEVASWTFPLGGNSAPSDPKDVKAMAPSDPGQSLTIGLTAFQGIYADNNEFNLNKGINRTDVWQFVEQVPVQYNFNKSTFVKVVPGFDVYTGGGNAGPGGGFTSTSNEDGGGTQNFIAPNAADDLAIFTAPGRIRLEVRQGSD